MAGAGKKRKWIGSVWQPESWLRDGDVRGPGKASANSSGLRHSNSQGVNPRITILDHSNKPGRTTAAFLVGFVILAAATVQAEFVTSIVDNQGDAGRLGSSLVVTDQDEIVVALRNETFNELRLARIAGITIQVETILQGGGLSAVVGVSSFGETEIAHALIPGQGLSMTLQVPGLEWFTTPIDPGGSGGGISMVLSDTDEPHVVYLDQTQTLKYATYDPQQNGWVTEIILSGTSGIINQSSIAVDTSGRPTIAVGNQISEEIIVASRTNQGWHFLPSLAGSFGSIAVDSQGRPAVAYVSRATGSRLMFATFSVAGWIVTEIANTAPVTTVPIVSFDGNDKPGIAFDRARRLMYATNQLGWTMEAADQTTNDAVPRSLTFDSDNRPVICFYDGQQDDADGTSVKIATKGLGKKCRADLNADGRVDYADFALLAAAWGPTPTLLSTDFDGNGQIDPADLLVLLDCWLLAND